MSPELQVASLPAEPQGKPKNTGLGSLPLLQQISPWPRNWTRVSFIAGGFFTNWAMREAQLQQRGKERKRKEKKCKRIYRTNQKLRTINIFLESLLSESFPSLGVSPPHLPRMPSNTVLISGPAVRAAQILIWPYSYVFLPPMSTAIRTSALSFVGALKGLIYIP